MSNDTPIDDPGPSEDPTASATDAATPSESAAPIILAVPSTSFDLLEGSASSKSKSRLLNAAVLILVVAVLVGLASRGLLMRIDAGTARSDADTAEQETQQALAELAAARETGAVSGPAVAAHIGERVQFIRTATTGEINYADIIGAIYSLPNVAVTNITFGGSAVAPQQNTQPQNTQSGSTQPDPSTVKGSVTVSGVASSNEAAGAATAALSDPARFPMLTSGTQGKITCREGTCSWSWSGAVAESAKSHRTEALVTRAQSGVPAQAPPGGN